MRSSASLALLAGLLLAPAIAHAQTPYVGLSAGVQKLPGVFDNCGNDGRTALEARGGIALGLVAVEARVFNAAEIGTATCVFAAASVLPPGPPPDGTVSYVEYPFARNELSHTAADLRLRVGGTRELPFTVSAGGGYTPTYDLPYLLAAVGVRTGGGRFRVALDVERDWYRVESELVTNRWENSQLVETTRLEREGWLGGMGMRLGVEMAVR